MTSKILRRNPNTHWLRRLRAARGRTNVESAEKKVLITNPTLKRNKTSRIATIKIQTPFHPGYLEFYQICNVETPPFIPGDETLPTEGGNAVIPGGLLAVD